MPSLVEIGFVVQEKVLKSYQGIFVIQLLSSFGKGCGPWFEKFSCSLYLKMFCVIFGWNWTRSRLWRKKNFMHFYYFAIRGKLGIFTNKLGKIEPIFRISATEKVLINPWNVTNWTRNTVSNAHKMIPLAPPCFVWQSPCFALGHTKIIRIKT